MEIPAGPGPGVSLDRDRLARANETYRKCAAWQRIEDDAAAQRETSGTGLGREQVLTRGGVVTPLSKGVRRAEFKLRTWGRRRIIVCPERRLARSLTIMGNNRTSGEAVIGPGAIGGNPRG